MDSDSDLKFTSKKCECCGDEFETEWDGVFCCELCENGEKECRAWNISNGLPYDHSEDESYETSDHGDSVYPK